jgi:Carboxylesterase family
VIPVGYVVTIALACCCTLAALTSRRAGGVLGPVQYFLGFVVNEQPVLACYWLGAATLLAAAQGDMRTPVARLAAGAAAILVGGLVLLAVRSLPAGAVIDQALDDGMPASWRAAAGVRSAADLTPRFQAARLLAWPLLVRRLDVRRIAGIRYGDAGRANLLDVYRCRRRPAGQDLRPVLVHVHGGALVMGRKNREGRPLMYRLASRGWVCVSPNYRLRPAARWPDHVVDVKRSSPGCASTDQSTARIRTGSSWPAPRRARSSQPWRRSRRRSRGSSLALTRLTPRSAPRSRSTATTDGATPASVPRHRRRWLTCMLMRRRSSLPMATATRCCQQALRASSRRPCATDRAVRSCTPSCPARSTSSTYSTRSAASQCATASRRSLPGYSAVGGYRDPRAGTHLRPIQVRQPGYWRIVSNGAAYDSQAASHRSATHRTAA